MTEALWFVAIGVLVVGLTFLTPLLNRLPLSISMVHLGIGVLLGPLGFGVLRWDIIEDAHLFELATEITVLVSLFTVGLTMRRSLKDRFWFLPVRLATITMVVTIGGIALAGQYLLGLPLGAAILLGAIISPTDPVLASDVQIKEPTDKDALRYSLSGEAGLNDGTAFPFVLLGLGLLGLHPDAKEILPWMSPTFSLWSWLLWDLLWAVTVGLGIGAACGWLIGHTALFMQRRLSNAFSLHELLVLGLIALAYGAAELAYGYGFLAVFAAGYALRYIELHATDHAPESAELPAITPGSAQETLNEVSQDHSKAAQFLAVSLRDFNDKLEHLLMAAVVVVIGASLTLEYLNLDVVWLAPLLFLLIRPVAAAVGLAGAQTSKLQTALVGWFGIRGLGSLYYLTYAISHGLPTPLAQQLTSIVLSLIVVSIVVHGISVTPLMSWYESTTEQKQEPATPQASS